MTPEQLERLGQLVDTADNALAWDSNSFASVAMRKDAFRAGLMILRDRIKALYLELGGSDEWSDDDTD